MSTGDKIVSENYFQHADHFTRILNEQENFKKSQSEIKSVTETVNVSNETSIGSLEVDENQKQPI